MTALIKHANVLVAERPLATIVGKRVTSRVNAPLLSVIAPAIVAGKLGISLVNVLKIMAAEAVEALAAAPQADMVEVVEAAAAPNVMLADRPAILLAHVLHALEEVVVDTVVVVMVAEEAATVVEVDGEEAAALAVVEEEVNSVIRVEVMAMCPVNAIRGKNVITVSTLQGTISTNADLHTGGETGHLSRECPSEVSSERTCYKCRQPGHVQAACPN